MTGPVESRFLSTTRPPPAERLAEAYFGPLLAPVPVATRLPRPAATADTVNGFLRVEAGGGLLRSARGSEQILWEVQVVLHGYAPNSVESLAEEIVGRAVTWGANAQGTTTEVGSDRWYIAYSTCSGLGVRKADPLVAMTRYRAAVTWRVPGLPVLPGDELVRYTPSPRVLGAPRPSRRR